MHSDGKMLRRILGAALFIAISISRSQIPASGSDLASLSKIRWGMALPEARERLAREIDKITDTSIAFPDSFLSSRVHVTLTFGKADSDKGLRLAEVEFDDKNVGRVRHLSS